MKIPLAFKIIGGTILGFGIMFFYFVATNGNSAGGPNPAGFSTELPIQSVDIEADRNRYQNIAKTDIQETVAERLRKEQEHSDRIKEYESTDLPSLDSKSTADRDVANTFKFNEEKPKVQPLKPKVKTVTASAGNTTKEQKAEESYFYTITASDINAAAEATSAINAKATVYGTYNLASGDRVKIRTMEPMQIDGITIPANTILNGIASAGSNQRLLIKVHRIEYRRENYISNLTIFDQDGMEGLFVPNNAVNEQVGETSENVVAGAADVLTNGMYGLGDVVQGVVQVNRAGAQKVYVRDGFPIILRSAVNN